MRATLKSGLLEGRGNNLNTWHLISLTFLFQIHAVKCSHESGDLERKKKSFPELVNKPNKLFFLAMNISMSKESFHRQNLVIFLPGEII